MPSPGGITFGLPVLLLFWRHFHLSPPGLGVWRFVKWTHRAENSWEKVAGTWLVGCPSLTLSLSRCQTPAINLFPLHIGHLTLFCLLTSLSLWLCYFLWHSKLALPAPLILPCWPHMKLLNFAFQHHYCILPPSPNSCNWHRAIQIVSLQHLHTVA